MKSGRLHIQHPVISCNFWGGVGLWGICCSNVFVKTIGLMHMCLCTVLKLASTVQKIELIWSKKGYVNQKDFGSLCWQQLLSGMENTACIVSDNELKLHLVKYYLAWLKFLENLLSKCHT